MQFCSILESLKQTFKVICSITIGGEMLSFLFSLWRNHLRSVGSPKVKDNNINTGPGFRCTRKDKFSPLWCIQMSQSSQKQDFLVFWILSLLLLSSLTTPADMWHSQLIGVHNPPCKCLAYEHQWAVQLKLPRPVFPQPLCSVFLTFLPSHLPDPTEAPFSPPLASFALWSFVNPKSFISVSLPYFFKDQYKLKEAFSDNEKHLEMPEDGEQGWALLCRSHCFLWVRPRTHTKE